MKFKSELINTVILGKPKLIDTFVDIYFNNRVMRGSKMVVSNNEPPVGTNQVETYSELITEHPSLHTASVPQLVIYLCYPSYLFTLLSWDYCIRVWIQVVHFRVTAEWSQQSLPLITSQRSHPVSD